MTQSTPRHLQVGTTLQNGKYRIVKVLGQGGFGITYLAEHAIFGEVALKELFLNSGSTVCTRDITTHCQVIAQFEGTQFDTFKKRFSEEAKTLYNLRRIQGVVHVQEIFEENSTIYFSMEYLRGDKLEDYVEKRNQLTEQEGLQIIKSLTSTLSEVHKKDVLHRDIKPSNIIIDESGGVHLIDFGIARSYIDEITETHLHTTFHSPRYSAPEQKISSSRMGTYSDIYSLGAVAYFVFTGKQPQNFEERTLEEYQPPKSLVPTLSDSVNDAINRSLELRPEKRFQTADKFLQSLTSKDSSFQTLPVSDQEVTMIDRPNQLLEREDKTVIDQSIEINSKQDQTVIDGPISTKEIKNDHESTLIEPTNSKQKKKFNWERFRNWMKILDWQRHKNWLKNLSWEKYIKRPRNKKAIKITSGVLSVLFIIFLIRYCDNGKNETLPQKHFLSLSVVDTLNRPLGNPKLRILGVDSAFTLGSNGVYHMDILKDWNKLRFRKVIVSHPGFFPTELSLESIADNTVFTIRLTPGKIETPDIFCKNIIGKWHFNDQDSLALDSCKYNDKSNPKGIASYNNREGDWSSLQREGSIFIKVVFREGYPQELTFLVQSHFDSLATCLELVSDGNTVTFERPSIIIDSILSLRDQVVRELKIQKKIINGRDNTPVRSARIAIMNSNRKSRSGNTGWFEIDVTNLGNGQIEISHRDYNTKKLLISSELRNNSNIIKLTPKDAVTIEYFIDIKVVDINGNPVEGAVVKILNNNKPRITNRFGMYKEKFINDWNSIENQGIEVSHPDFKLKTYNSVTQIANKNGFIVPLDPKAPKPVYPNPCESVKGVWVNKSGGRVKKTNTLALETCSAPSNKGSFNGKSGTWQNSAVSNDKKSMVIVFTFKDIPNEKITFKVHNPFNKKDSSLELLNKSSTDIPSNKGDVYKRE
jgi:serine/threonine protein kinase